MLQQSAAVRGGSGHLDQPGLTDVPQPQRFRLAALLSLGGAGGANQINISNLYRPQLSILVNY